jgi:hypothetical protein
MKILLTIIFLSTLLFSCIEQTSIPFSFSPYDQWRSYNIHNYTIEQIRHCYCVNRGQGMKITIKSDSIYSVMRLSDLTLLPYSDFKQYLNIESLFGIIKNSKTDSLIISYDSKYGYPNKLDINPQLIPRDLGLTYTTSNLQITK